MLIFEILEITDLHLFITVFTTDLKNSLHIYAHKYIYPWKLSGPLSVRVWEYALAFEFIDTRRSLLRQFIFSVLPPHPPHSSATRNSSLPFDNWPTAKANNGPQDCPEHTHAHSYMHMPYPFNRAADVNITAAINSKL